MSHVPIRYEVRPHGGGWLIWDREACLVVQHFDRRHEAQREVLRLRLEHEGRTA